MKDRSIDTSTPESRREDCRQRILRQIQDGQHQDLIRDTILDTQGDDTIAIIMALYFPNECPTNACAMKDMQAAMDHMIDDLVTEEFEFSEQNRIAA